MIDYPPIAMKDKTFLIATVISAVLLAASCRTNSTKPVLSDEKVESIYIALLEGQERVNALPPDSSKFNSDSVFQSFGTSEDEFRAAIARYRSDPTRWKRFFEEVVKRIEQKRDSVNHPRPVKQG